MSSAAAQRRNNNSNSNSNAPGAPQPSSAAATAARRSISITSVPPDGLACEPVLLRARPPQSRLDRAPFVMLYSLAAMQAFNVSVLGLKR